MATEATKSVRDLVLERPGAARIFEKLGIDYCCGGQKSLAEACIQANLKQEDVLAALEQPEKAAPERDWRRARLAELIRHIVDTHHVFTREEISRLAPLIAKVVSVHGKNHPELLQIQSLFRNLSEELTSHMRKEEQVLFPYIEGMEEAAEHGEPIPPAMFGTVQNPVRMMMMEHDSAGNTLHRMRELSHEYALPPDACVSYQKLYEVLQGFEKDLHTHIHLENNILFPRSLELENAAQ